MLQTYLEAALLGVIEGLTEFLPVSSTGHLILFGDLLGFSGPPGKVFEVVIQLGSILAVCVVYFDRLWGILIDLPWSVEARRFVIAVLVAFLPAVVLGTAFHGIIKSVLFTPPVVCGALVVGGVAILVIERLMHHTEFRRIEDFPISLSVKIGFLQCMAMIPGVSRSGATIMGALLMGVERRTAAEFSFFLAIPSMLGATVYDLYKNRDSLSLDDASLIGVGFVFAFLSGLLVVKTLVSFVGRHGFSIFGWYRIVVGLVMAGILVSGGSPAP